MSDTNALVPEAPILTGEEIVADHLDENLEQKDQERAELLITSGWEQVTAVLDRHIQNFRTGKGLTIDGNTPLEEIGKKFVIASTIASICEEIKADVINAANAVVERGK